MDTNGEGMINQNLKLIAKSSIIVFIGLIFSKLFLYIYRILIARYYSPKVYGLFALGVMVFGWFRVFSGLGFRQGLLRYISIFRGKKQEEKIPSLVKKSIMILFFTGVLAGTLLFISAEFIALKIFSSPDLIIFLKIFSCAIPLAIIGESLLAILRAYEKIGWHSFISNILGNLLTLGVLMLFFFVGVGIISIPLSYLIGVFSILIASYFVCRFNLSKIFKKEMKSMKAGSKAFREMFSYSWPFVFYGIVLLVFSWTDSLMLGIFRTAEEVGFYNAAMPFAALIEFPLAIFIQLFFPLVTKEFSKNNLEAVKQLSQQVGKWIFMVVIPIFILLMIFPGVFLNLFGPEYLVAESALRFLSIGILFSALFGLSHELLLMKGKSKLILFNMLIAGSLNVILNFFLVPRYGITGAGVATMFSLLLLNALLAIQAYRYLSIIPLRRKTFQIFLIALVSTALLLVVKLILPSSFLALFLGGFFFVAIYLLLILTTRCLDKNDLYILKVGLGKITKRRNLI